ncbi:hypothetical protein LCGC14_1427730 [marine sediment metagenome]|uniref:Uncharacterized protein n=1 Tax=marine sediment metagenome TaxID=412755 RepID=A0A0F9MR76_9ZZZZ
MKSPVGHGYMHRVGSNSLVEEKKAKEFEKNDYCIILKEKVDKKEEPSIRPKTKERKPVVKTR